MVIGTVGTAIAEAGVPDVLINMAGIGGAAQLVDMEFETFDRMIKINLYGTRNIVEAVLPAMLARGNGKIVLVGSMGGIIPVYGYTAYGSSKFAVVGLAQCLRYELKPLGISVACFCPGEVETPGLAAERKTLHPASAALKKIGGTIPVEAAVRGLVKGIEHDEAMIIPGWKVKFTYWMHRITPDQGVERRYRCHRREGDAGEHIGRWQRRSATPAILTLKGDSEVMEPREWDPNWAELCFNSNLRQSISFGAHSLNEQQES